MLGNGARFAELRTIFMPAILGRSSTDGSLGAGVNARSARDGGCPIKRWAAGALTPAALVELRSGLAPSRLCRCALETDGYALGERVVTLLSDAKRHPLVERIAAQVGKATVERGELTKGYYDGLRFMIDVRGAKGDIPLIDGCAFDWVGKLAANRKLVFVASAIGSQLVAHWFRL
jgi:hypothetical protein